VPLLGDIVLEGGSSFEVVELDGRRVSRVRVTRVVAGDDAVIPEGSPADPGGTTQ
jgi:CBS domain containing-hemolysin-like protein